MRSPFPGMDPYLEQHWGDVHTSLIIYARDQLLASLPPELFARVEERVYVENGQGDDRSVYPDVRVVEHSRAGPAVGVAGALDVAEPYIVHFPAEPVTETFIEIREVASGNRVVTVIEFLSLANKVPGPGQRLYRQKQQEWIGASVSLVEVDLLRAGQRISSVSYDLIPANIRTPYQVVVRRGWQLDRAEVYPLPLRQPLSAIRIPLRQTDSDLPLNLQTLIDQCYQNGRYHTVNYQRDPIPPLTGDDPAWADGLLRGAGKRP
jgi:Protein of unknown function (DUF4058)